MLTKTISTKISITHINNMLIQIVDLKTKRNKKWKRQTSRHQFYMDSIVGHVRNRSFQLRIERAPNSFEYKNPKNNIPDRIFNVVLFVLSKWNCRHLEFPRFESVYQNLWRTCDAHIIQLNILRINRSPVAKKNNNEQKLKKNTNPISNISRTSSQWLVYLCLFTRHEIIKYRLNVNVGAQFHGHQRCLNDEFVTTYCTAFEYTYSAHKFTLTFIHFNTYRCCQESHHYHSNGNELKRGSFYKKCTRNIHYDGLATQMQWFDDNDKFIPSHSSSEQESRKASSNLRLDMISYRTQNYYQLENKHIHLHACWSSSTLYIYWNA